MRGSVVKQFNAWYFDMWRKIAVTGLMSLFLLPWTTMADPKPLSGSAFLSPDLKALQNDSGANPIGLWLDQGKALWGTSNNPSSCFQCHGELETQKSVATQFPKWSARLKKLINLEDQIVACATRTAQPFKSLESPEVVALSAVLHQAAQGQPLQMSAPAIDAGEWQAQLHAGAQLFTTRIGRMNLACTHCHDQRVGRQMRADIISPGHPTGFPIFKMSWQSMGSIDRRLRACFSGVQADVPSPGSPELRQLELFLKMRAQGMTMEGPSLRR